MPAFRKPKSKNAATTLLMMGLIAVTMFGGIIALAWPPSVQGGRARRWPPTCSIDGTPVGPGYHQHPVIAQVADAVFGNGSIPFVVIAAVTALILFLAANTAFNGFPVLGSILAQDRYLPRQLHTRGDRLAFSNGIVSCWPGGRLLIVGLRRRRHPADPALHRRRLRLVHAQPDRHGPALEPAAAHRDATRGRAAG